MAEHRKLNKQKDAIQVKVLRAGAQLLVLNTEIVVGDVLVLDTGDKVRSQPGGRSDASPAAAL